MYFEVLLLKKRASNFTSPNVEKSLTQQVRGAKQPVSWFTFLGTSEFGLALWRNFMCIFVRNYSHFPLSFFVSLRNQIGRFSFILAIRVGLCDSSNAISVNQTVDKFFVIACGYGNFFGYINVAAVCVGCICR